VSIIKSSELKGLNNKWRALEPQRKTLQDFSSEYSVLSEDSKTMQQLMQQRISWSEKLNKLSLFLPAGVWFNELNVNRKDFTLSGSVVSLQKEEMALVDRFMDSLKADQGFFKDFLKLELRSVQKRTVGGYEITDFVLSGVLNSK
jgi:Tfp pilus assembly protein PilN